MRFLVKQPVPENLDKTYFNTNQSFTSLKSEVGARDQTSKKKIGEKIRIH